MNKPVENLKAEAIAAVDAAIEAAYRQGCDDTKAAMLVALRDGLPPVAMALKVPASLGHSGSPKGLALEDRKRAPRGLAKEMVLRALKASSTAKHGITSFELKQSAKDRAERMVSVSALKNEFRTARDDGLCELREGRWWPE